MNMPGDGVGDVQPGFGSFWKRACASAVDFLIVTLGLLLFLLVMTVVSRLAGQAELGRGHRLFFYGVALVWGLGYPTWFIGSTGQTIGKKVMELKVVRENGQPVGYVCALGRAASFFLYSLPFPLAALIFQVVSLWLLCTSPKRQALHDRMCSTVVLDFHA